MNTKIDFKLKSTKLLFIGILFSINLVSAQKQDWLNDQPPVNAFTRVQTNKFTNLTAYPRRSVGTMKNTALNAAQMACFDIICQKPFKQDVILAAQALNPNLSWLREYCPQEWQGGADADNKQSNGYPFNTTGPATANNQMFAGHWAYKPYTTISTAITATDVTISVADGINIKSGEYCVIYPADSWEKAEHVKITAKSGTLLTIQRAYKSIANSWSAGSKIAMHQRGNGTTADNWCYNLSTKCPLDANGKKLHEALAAWVAENYDEDGSGNALVAKMDGILYDSDAHFFVHGGNKDSRNADFDNNGVADWGFDPDGTNHWGNGLEQFYTDVRAGLDKRGHTNAVILCGVAESWGISQNNGTQLEAAWSGEFSQGAIATSYNDINYFISGLKLQSGYGTIGPRVTDIQGKEASALYYGTTIETRNEPVRFSYAMSCMFDGAWFSNQNSFGDPFHYFDEDAVYLSNDENYGKSVLKSNTADILKNNKWLGQALGSYQRVCNEADFSIDKNLFPNGDFENSISGWSGTLSSTSRVTDKFYEGSASVKIQPTNPNTNVLLNAATAVSPSITVQPNQEYSLCFAVYTESTSRIVNVTVGTMSQRLFVTPGWSKHIYTWKQGSSTSASVKFDVGAQLTPVWIDQLYIFKGNTDVFRRDFENGIVLANATPFAKTIQLNGNYRKILGNLDSQFNNGQSGLTEITLPAYNGVFLVKNKATGIRTQKQKSISVYPNPFNDSFTISLKDALCSEISITNIQGQVLKKIAHSDLNSKYTIGGLSDLPKGVYFVNFSNKNVCSSTKIYKI